MTLSTFAPPNPHETQSQFHLILHRFYPHPQALVKRNPRRIVGVAGELHVGAAQASAQGDEMVHQQPAQTGAAAGFIHTQLLHTQNAAGHETRPVHG